MAHAEKCPVCAGTGTRLKSITLVPPDAEPSGDTIATSNPEDEGRVNLDYSKHTLSLESESCHSCKGEGWVTVQDDDRPEQTKP